AGPALRDHRSPVQGAPGRVHADHPHREPGRGQCTDVDPRAGGEEREDRAGEEGRSREGGEEGRREGGRGGRREEAGEEEEVEEGAGGEAGEVASIFFWISREAAPPG